MSILIVSLGLLEVGVLLGILRLFSFIRCSFRYSQPGEVLGFAMLSEQPGVCLGHEMA